MSEVWSRDYRHKTMDYLQHPATTGAYCVEALRAEMPHESIGASINGLGADSLPVRFRSGATILTASIGAFIDAPFASGIMHRLYAWVCNRPEALLMTDVAPSWFLILPGLSLTIYPIIPQRRALFLYHHLHKTSVHCILAAARECSPRIALSHAPTVMIASLSRNCGRYC